MKNIMITLLMCLIVVGAVQAANPQVSALWHFDGNMDEEFGTGSTGFEWWGYDWATSVDAHSGSGALDVTDSVHGMQGIDLLGNAQINGTNGFGIAMWVKRTGVNYSYPALFGFGSDSLFQLAEHGWYPGSGLLLATHSDLGTIPVGAGGSSFIHTPLDTWSFVAVYTYDQGGQRYLAFYSADLASGQTGWYSLVINPSSAVLNGSNRLWLGGIAGDTRNFKCLVDELIINNQVCAPDWAETLYNATKSGENLLVLRDCADVYLNDIGIAGDTNHDCHVDAADFSDVAANWGQINDPNLTIDRAANLLRIEMEGSDWTLSKDQLEQRIFNIREDPLLGAFSSDVFMDDALLRARFSDMIAHNCNSVLLRSSGVLSGSTPTLRFIEIAHERGLQVYGIPNVSPPASLLDTYPGIAMLDQYGVSMGVPCVLANEYKAYVTDQYDPNVIAASGLDGIMLDEPAFPAWRTSYDTGRIGCYGSECQVRYNTPQF